MLRSASRTHEANTPIQVKISTKATSSSAARFATPVTNAVIATAKPAAIEREARTSRRET